MCWINIKLLVKIQNYTIPCRHKNIYQARSRASNSYWSPLFDAGNGDHSLSHFIGDGWRPPYINMHYNRNYTYNVFIIWLNILANYCKSYRTELVSVERARPSLVRKCEKKIGYRNRRTTHFSSSTTAQLKRQNNITIIIIIAGRTAAAE